MHQRKSEAAPHGSLASPHNNEISSPYTVPKLTLFDPANRHLKIITIGAGVSGILMAYKIQKHMPNVELKIYERNADIGGTWLLNRYPGCACDIPSHAYTYSFALNPNWPSFFSPAKDIWTYLDRVCKTWNLRKFMTFSTEVVNCHWQEETSKWIVNMRTVASDGTSADFSDECDVLLHATGVLDKFKWPKIEGLDTFKGKLVHTARWPETYQAEAWNDEKVVIIGSGASSIQTVPKMQPHVKDLSIFMRTPVWFVEIAGNDGKNIAYTANQKSEFQSDPASLVAHAKSLEDQVNSGWSMMIKGSADQLAAQDHFRKRTAQIVKDPEIANRITPKFSVGCRRITPGDPYLNAIQQPNVKVVFEEAVRIMNASVFGKEGTEVNDVDTIVCATGFDTSFRPAFSIVGRDGVDLRHKWVKRPEGYLGSTAPDMPNFFTLIGPSWPIGNGSVMGPLEAVGDYIIKFLQKMQREMISSFEVRQDITDAFNQHVQEYMKDTVWSDSCRSWYKDHESGRVNAVWPGSSLHYIEAIEEVRYEDFVLKYEGEGKGGFNPWQYLGNGFTQATLDAKADKSPYLAVDRIDEAWLGSRNIESDVKEAEKVDVEKPRDCVEGRKGSQVGQVEEVLLTA